MQGMPSAQDPTSPQVSAQQGSLYHRGISTPASVHPSDMSSGPQIKTEGIKLDPDYVQQTESSTLSQGGSSSFQPLWQDMGPFTTSLSPEFVVDNMLDSQVRHGARVVKRPG